MQLQQPVPNSSIHPARLRSISREGCPPEPFGEGGLSLGSHSAYCRADSISRNLDLMTAVAPPSGSTPCGAVVYRAVSSSIGSAQPSANKRRADLAGRAIA
jgi:hypothetical protein